MSDTIAAISTGNVVSAIGIVRVSGDRALDVIDRVFLPFDGLPMSSHKDRTLVLGELKTADGDLLDMCLCTKSCAPNSYTGEDTAELQCHGSPTVLRLALEALFTVGARQALAGEFTKRAFLNRKLDLTMAEAVIDLIDSETKDAARNAAAQLGGSVSRKTEGIYSALVDIVSHYYAVVDYPDEDIEPFLISEYANTLRASADTLRKLLSTFERGLVMRNGLPTAIIGRPNAGKSSLLNLLLGYDRAIVTDIPGTTRDTVEEKVNIGGLSLLLCDTAGLRSADGVVEQLGVERSKLAAAGAELVIAVFDGSLELSEDDAEVLDLAANAPRKIAIINKNDLPQVLSADMLPSFFDRVILLSTLTGEGLPTLSESIGELFPLPAVPAGEILTNARQADAVKRALESVDSAIIALDSGMTADAVLTEAEQAMNCLSELSGRAIRDDISERIFSRFCVGK